jgi:nucleotide-binding universal stress UspA family protein
MDLKRILVALNSPNGRDAAFERALALARSSGAELYLLHAVPVSDPFSFRSAERLKRIADMRERAEAAGVRVHAVEQHGDAAEIIELHANARDVDLIVMGTEPRRRRWGRGRSAVAERVIARTNVPTLLIASDSPASPASFRSVLVAVDLSLISNHLLEAAVRLAAGEGAQLTVVHTVKGTRIPEDARSAVEAVVSAIPASVETRVLVAAGAAAPTILREAEDVGADLVVVGRSRGFKVFGSTALRVLRKNERALLVIPTSDRRATHLEWQRAA